MSTATSRISPSGPRESPSYIELSAPGKLGDRGAASERAVRRRHAPPMGDVHAELMQSWLSGLVQPGRRLLLQGLMLTWAFLS